jgi:aryl-alcohol dehydrogenase-like predicted oxidoreductase
VHVAHALQPVARKPGRILRGGLDRGERPRDGRGGGAHLGGGLRPGAGHLEVVPPFARERGALGDAPLLLDREAFLRSAALLAVDAVGVDRLRHVVEVDVDEDQRVIRLGVTRELQTPDLVRDVRIRLAVDLFEQRFNGVPLDLAAAPAARRLERQQRSGGCGRRLGQPGRSRPAARGEKERDQPGDQDQQRRADGALGARHLTRPAAGKNGGAPGRHDRVTSYKQARRERAVSEELDRRQFLKSATVAAVGLSLARGLHAEEDKESDLVKRRPLGKTGIQASVIAYGCGGTTPRDLPMLRAAHERGVNLYDTAWGYQNGQSEVAIGEFVKAIKDRESIHIVTKATGFRPPRGSSKQVYEAFKERITAHLRKLQSEYIDVYYWPHGAASKGQTEDKAAREALLKLKQEKLIHHIGTSSHKNYVEVGEAAIASGFYEVYMPVINICTQSGKSASGTRRPVEDTRKMLKAAKKKNFGIVGMKVANPGFLGRDADTLLDKEFGGDSNLSRHQKLYRYMLKQEGVNSVVVGIRAAKHLKEAVEVGKIA